MVSFVTFLKSPGRAGIAYIYSLTEPRKQAYRLGAAYSRAIGQRDKVGGCKICAGIGSANGPQRLFLTQASTKKCLVHQHKATDFGSVYSTLLEERDLLISIAASLIIISIADMNNNNGLKVHTIINRGGTALR